MNQSSSKPKTFNTINDTALMAQEFESLQFAVDKILPHGIFILAGSGKIGKSWLALDACSAVSSGGKLWDFDTPQGDTLYLALEDKHQRLQGRLKKIEADGNDVSRFHLTTSSFGINSGMLEQTHNFIAEHSNTKLIIVDTLERIRDTGQGGSLYSCDYHDIYKLREITDKHRLTLLLIHHTRKMHDSDPLNTLSGSTGLVGAVDGVFVLEKEKRTSNRAKLTIANRDTEGFCFKLKLDSEKCKWQFLGDASDDDDVKSEHDLSDKDKALVPLVDGFLQNQDGEAWSGTATELCQGLKDFDENFDGFPVDTAKRLRALDGFFKDELGVQLVFDREHKGKAISISRAEHTDGDSPAQDE